MEIKIYGAFLNRARVRSAANAPAPRWCRRTTPPPMWPFARSASAIGGPGMASSRPSRASTASDHRLAVLPLQLVVPRGARGTGPGSGRSAPRPRRGARAAGSSRRPPSSYRGSFWAGAGGSRPNPSGMRGAGVGAGGGRGLFSPPCSFPTAGGSQSNGAHALKARLASSPSMRQIEPIWSKSSRSKPSAILTYLTSALRQQQSGYERASTQTCHPSPAVC